MTQNELREVAKKIILNLYGSPYEEINSQNGFGAINDIVSNLNLKDGINFYPSNSKGACCLDAIFLSIKHQPRQKTLSRNEMVPLKSVLEKISQHIFGECRGYTNQIILITDTIDTDVIKPWISSFKNSNCWIEIIYVRENGEFEVGNKLIGLI
jgi:hypothetical protein